MIFADEPTGNLDSKTGGEVLGFMRRAVSDLGQTIVMVTHDANAASYADRIVFLKDGKIAGEMTEPNPEKVLDYLTELRKTAPSATPRWISGHGELESLLGRLNSSVGFAQTTPEAAADNFFSEADRILA